MVVWSFGITCLEILTRNRPYPNLSTRKSRDRFLLRSANIFFSSLYLYLAQFKEKFAEEFAKLPSYIPSDTPPQVADVLKGEISWFILCYVVLCRGCCCCLLLLVTFSSLCVQLALSLTPVSEQPSKPSATALMKLHQLFRAHLKFS